MVVSLAPKMGMDNVLSTLGFHNQSKLPKFPFAEVSHLHVSFISVGFWWQSGLQVFIHKKDQFYVYTQV
jgi:hypothetical protein